MLYVVGVCLLSVMLHTVDSTVRDKFIATSRDAQNMSVYLLNEGNFV